MKINTLSINVLLANRKQMFTCTVTQVKLKIVQLFKNLKKQYTLQRIGRCTETKRDLVIALHWTGKGREKLKALVCVGSL